MSTRRRQNEVTSIEGNRTIIFFIAFLCKTLLHKWVEVEVMQMNDDKSLKKLINSQFLSENVCSFQFLRFIFIFSSEIFTSTTHRPRLSVKSWIISDLMGAWVFLFLLCIGGNYIFPVLAVKSWEILRFRIVHKLNVVQQSMGLWMICMLKRRICV